MESMGLSLSARDILTLALPSLRRKGNAPHKPARVLLPGRKCSRKQTVSFSFCGGTIEFTGEDEDLLVEQVVTLMHVLAAPHHRGCTVTVRTAAGVDHSGRFPIPQLSDWRNRFFEETLRDFGFREALQKGKVSLELRRDNEFFFARSAEELLALLSGQSVRMPVRIRPVLMPWCVACDGGIVLLEDTERLVGQVFDIMNAMSREYCGVSQVGVRQWRYPPV